MRTDEKADEDEAAPHAHAVPEDDIPELEDEPMEQALLQDFIDSDEEVGPASPGGGPGTRTLDDGPLTRTRRSGLPLRAPGPAHGRWTMVQSL